MPFSDSLFHTAPARTGAGLKEISNIYQAGHFVTVNHEDRRNYPNGNDFAPRAGLPRVHRVGAGATAWGCGLFRFAPRWMASVAGAGAGRCAPGFFVGNCGPWAKANAREQVRIVPGEVFTSLPVYRFAAQVFPRQPQGPKQTWRVRHESYNRTICKGYPVHA